LLHFVVVLTEFCGIKVLKMEEFAFSETHVPNYQTRRHVMRDGLVETGSGFHLTITGS
jgi:hypothetical protein